MDNKEDNIQSINEFDYNLICEYFSSIDRQGPGSEESTLQALRFIDSLPQDACIAALDLFPLFIEKLAQRAADCGQTPITSPSVRHSKFSLSAITTTPRRRAYPQPTPRSRAIRPL